MKVPKTIQEVEELIKNKIQESIHLDYKDSRALQGKSGEIAKDVSAFANSDGGIIIYGVTEVNKLPERVDGGVDHIKYSRERIEQIINSNVTPPLENLLIHQIELNNTNSIYVIEVERSNRAPHQEKQSKKYYKRHNFTSSPMEDYEIRDVRNRIITYPPLINISLSIDQGAFIELCVENIGDTTASDINFEFSEDLKWERGIPAQLILGIKHLPRGQKLAFLYTTVSEAFKSDSELKKSFTVRTSYFNPLAGKRMSEEFPIDIGIYEGTSILYTELHRHGEKLKDSINKLVQASENISKQLENISTISGATGLKISVSTLRLIAAFMAGKDDVEGLNPEDCSILGFKEILDIPISEAFSLYEYFQYDHGAKKLEDLPKVSKETIEKFNKYFKNINTQL